MATWGLDRTTPLACAKTGGDAEIHMLLCKRDLRIGVLALKSLLRFLGDKLGVAITDDGSLSSGDREWVSRHIHGCRWLPPKLPAATIEARLAPFPNLRQLYVSGFAFAKKLIHPIVAASAPKVISLDSDTLFMRRPEQLERWVCGNGDPAHYLRDVRKDEAAEVPEDVVAMFSQLASLLSNPLWRVPHYYFNAGLLAYTPTQCDLGLAEGFLAWRKTLPPPLRVGTPGIWFGPWTQEQSSYLVMFGGFSPRPVSFDDGYRIGTGVGHTFYHFLRAGICSQEGLTAVSSIVEQLRSAG